MARAPKKSPTPPKPPKHKARAKKHGLTVLTGKQIQHRKMQADINNQRLFNSVKKMFGIK